MTEHGDDRRIEGALYLRLDELHQWHDVEAKCWKCGHTASVPLATLKRGRSPFTKLVELGSNLRCTNCGTAGAQELIVRKLPRNC
jgi:hypothetical protein